MSQDALSAASAQEQLLELHGALRDARTVGELLARACALVRRECGFSRSVILGISGEHLTADGIDPLEDPASDLLRRTVLASPIPLRGWNEESVLLRGEAQRARRTEARSVVAEALRLKRYVLAPLVPESAPVALLVVDRTDPVDEAAAAEVRRFAAMTAIALEQAVLRARMGEITAELRFLSGSVLGLVGEMADTPIAIPSQGRHGPVFSALAPNAAPGLRDPGGDELLTPREHEVAQLLTQGRSNRQIAEELHLSPDTVKGNVAAIMRKLDASNRAAAAARYIAATRPEGG